MTQMDVLDDYENSLISGELFREITSGCRLVKLVQCYNSADCYENAVKLVDGINSNNLRNTSSQYVVGGFECHLFGTSLLIKAKIENYIAYQKYVYDVAIPDDAQVFIKKDGIMSDKVVLSNKRRFEDLEEWSSEEFCKLAITVSPGFSKYTNVICELDEASQVAMVQQSWLSIESIKNPCDAACRAALILSFNAFKYIDNPSQQICVEAVNVSSENFKYVPDNKKSYEVYLALVTKVPSKLAEVPEFFLTEELITACLKNSGLALLSVPSYLLNERVCLAAAKGPIDQQHLEALIVYMSEHLNIETCSLLVSRNMTSIKYIPERFITREFYQNVITLNPHYIRHMPFEMVDKDICVVAVTKNGLTLEFIPKCFQTEELCLIAIKNNGLALGHVKIDKTSEMCELACSLNHLAAKYVPDTIDNDVATISMIKSNPNHILSLKTVTDEMVITAVLRRPILLEKLMREYVTPNVLMEVIKIDPKSLQYVEQNKQTVDLCAMAVKKDPWCIKYVKIYNEQINLEAVRGNPHTMSAIKALNESVCIEALKGSGVVLNSVPEVLKTPKLYYEFIKNNQTAFNYMCGTVGYVDWDQGQQEDIVAIDGRCIKFIENPTVEMCEIAVMQHGMAIKHINEKLHTFELCRLAVDQNPYLIAEIKIKSIELALIAIHKNYKVINMINWLTVEECILACIMRPQVLQIMNDPHMKNVCTVLINNILTHKQVRPHKKAKSFFMD
jgi:hypothetical protein